ncbi:serine hydrolase [Flavihumibacter rivuli]|uniref:serine hydrolase n=1 Tax=Flavihumibacter rivuli TaxID=2838156 RepID=UPI001BDF3091|nr:serine hydrolase [Flavihumibacter rivuli]ULQ55669.1 serine hydrolase [Flavihumibacter rivuli]
MRYPKMLLLFSICLLTTNWLSAQRKQKGMDTTAVFDAYAKKAMEDWRVPGMAIAVVRDNKVVYRKAYGTTRLGTGKAVDEQTLFACASTTKAMTAACMGMLVDEGKVKWTDPVIKYLPDFRVYDPYVTRELQIRDLFIHNSGVGNADFLWGYNTLDSDGILRQMALVKPSYSFRSSYIYQNIFYLVAGKVIEKVSGMTWAAFMDQRIFRPLGMSRTKAELRLVKDDNIATPHYVIDSVVQPIVRDTADQVGPAGSVYSSIEDITKWVSCMLDSSKYSGGRLVKPETWKELLRPQVILPAEEFYPTQRLTHPNFLTYAMGWFQHDYKGKKLNMHTGSLSGEVAIHGQIPEVNTAVYVFANLDHAEMRHALMYKAFDLYALGGNRDWHQEMFALYQSIQKNRAQQVKEFESKRVTGTKPSHDLKDYAGVYEDPLYGKIEITLQGDRLLLVLNDRGKGKLEHWHYDAFKMQWDEKWNGSMLIGFQSDGYGKIRELIYGNAVFHKRPE